MKLVTIAVVNESTVVHDTEVRTWVAGIQAQVTGDFASVWDVDAILRFHTAKAKPSASDWVVAVLDNSDQAGALGYHDLTPAGQPLAKCFAKDDLTDGVSASVTMSHEVLEMLADPWLCVAFQAPNGVFWACEVGDAVEADQFGYKVGNVLVSDFVTPSWFGVPGGQYDFRGHCHKPFEVLQGGYSQKWQDGKGWVGAETPPGSRRQRRSKAELTLSTAERLSD